MGKCSPAAQAIGLPILFAAFLLVAAPFAWLLYGAAGLVSAAFAAAVCLIASWLALLVTAFFAPPEHAASHVLVGMMLRMALPLAVCLVAAQRREWLIDAGFPGFLIAAFTLGLLAETLLSVSKLQATTAAVSAPQNSTPDLPSSSGSSA